MSATLATAAATIATGAAIFGEVLDFGGSLYAGWQAEGNKEKIKEAKVGINDIFKAQKDLAGRTRDLAADKAYSGMESGIIKAGFGTRTSALQNIASLDKNVKRSGGLVSSGDVTTSAASANANMWDMYKENTGQMRDAYDFSIRAGDIAHDEAMASAEQNRQERLKSLESIPDDFFEGFFGSV